jgi:hypothetical protein
VYITPVQLAKVGILGKPLSIIPSAAMMNAAAIQSNVLCFQSNLHLAIHSIHILTTLQTLYIVKY